MDAKILFHPKLDPVNPAATINRHFVWTLDMGKNSSRPLQRLDCFKFVWLISASAYPVNPHFRWNVQDYEQIRLWSEPLVLGQNPFRICTVRSLVRGG